ncbi:MAG TPA: hypothetical protein PLP30_09740 [Clostridia bacterium]|nr:hypothetical protein [Clostridia bacterium]
MKRVLLFILSLVLILIHLTGCKTDNLKEFDDIQVHLSNVPTADIEENDNNKIIIYYPVQIANDSFYQSMPENIKQEWESIITDLGGVEVEIRFISDEFDSETLISMKPGGLVYIQDPGILYKLILTDVLIPLNDYRVLVDGFDSLDFEAFLAFTDDYGKIWGMPSSNRSIVLTRAYNSNWLNKMNAEIPSSIYELERLGLQAKHMKSDKEVFILGLDDSSLCSSELSDIFRAFGCFSQIKNENISFDQSTGTYYDIVFTQEFKDAMEFIAHLVKTDLIYFQPGKINEIQIEGKEFLSGIYAKGDSEIVYGYQLSGPNEEKLISILQVARGFGVIKGTDDIESKLDYFINNAYLNKELINAFRYGVEGFHYEIENGYINRLNYTRMLTPIEADIALMEDTENDILDGKIHPANSYTFMRNLIDANPDEIYYQHIFDKSRMGTAPPEFNENDGQSIERIITANYKKLMSEILSLDKSVEEAILDYEFRCNQIKYQEYITWLNSP